jgi:hypothetical protein
MKWRWNIFVLKVYADFTYMTVDMGRYPVPISCTLKHRCRVQILELSVLRVEPLHTQRSVVCPLQFLLIHVCDPKRDSIKNMFSESADFSDSGMMCLEF